MKRTVDNGMDWDWRKGRGSRSIESGNGEGDVSMALETATMLVRRDYDTHICAYNSTQCLTQASEKSRAQIRRINLQTSLHCLFPSPLLRRGGKVTEPSKEQPLAQHNRHHQLSQTSNPLPLRHPKPLPQTRTHVKRPSFPCITLELQITRKVGIFAWDPVAKPGSAKCKKKDEEMKRIGIATSSR